MDTEKERHEEDEDNEADEKDEAGQRSSVAAVVLLLLDEEEEEASTVSMAEEEWGRGEESRDEGVGASGRDMVKVRFNREEAEGADVTCWEWMGSSYGSWVAAVVTAEE